MPEHPQSNSLAPLDADADADEHARLRSLNRTPKPYHHLSPDLPYGSDRFTVRDQTQHDENDTHHVNGYLKDSSPASESGTEADDEHFLKGLPAPKPKSHKGLRGREDALSGASTPLLSPAAFEKDAPDYYLKKAKPAKQAPERRRVLDILRRNKNIVQRTTEAAIVASLGLMVRANKQVKPLVDAWSKDFALLAVLYCTSLLLYPLRVIAWEYRRGKPSKALPVSLPPNFDPAPILYPPAITTYASLLVATDNPSVILPNIILSVCSWPQQIIPRFETNTPYDSIHWALTCIPIAWQSSQEGFPADSTISAEDLTLLYPLHQILCVVLHHLTTTSLLTAELQLFSIALINVLVLASSPQIQILKALLWVGGVSVLVLCGSIIKSGIILARVPKWRFRKIASHKQRSVLAELSKIFSWRRIKGEVFGSALEPAGGETTSSDENTDVLLPRRPIRVQTLNPDVGKSVELGSPTSPTSDTPEFQPDGLTRRHTLSYMDGGPQAHLAHTTSGRRRRAISVSVRPFLKLTYTQAVIRKWLYASYVYVVLASVIIVGVRTHIQNIALKGTEPIGFALGYMFGDWSWFRFQVVKANLGRWIPLPPRRGDKDPQCQLGWVQHIRHNDFGEANTRLLIAAYWFMVFVIGLVTVFRLKEIYEVDTRRKVFHFMMVGILLPATFVDPTFAALALALILAIFLMLDLLRASQLPPLSKPIASFLAPYVDGRDFRGPVVISHIFLLIGCAIPLWLAMAALPRSGSGYLSGWEIPSREVSMVSGVICVGLGDAAASLIGRRFGRRKWIWGGGKSLEGSLAFALAVFVGLSAASIWLRIGRWPVAGERPGVVASARNAAACSSMASLTEAVLTGGNDNVIVPVVLWACVKSLAV